MSTENILRITLFISVFALNPAMAERPKLQTQINTQELTAITAEISDILYARGLDADAAQKLSKNIVSKNEAQFLQMVENVINGCEVVSKEKLLIQLSKDALFRNEVALENYDHLIRMVAEMTQRPLDKPTLISLKEIAVKNQLLKA